MPGTAVSQRRSTRRWIMDHYPGHRKDAQKRSERLKRRVENEKVRAQRKAKKG